MFLSATPEAPAAGAARYVGAQRCKTCHPFEFEVWSTGPHANAHKSLSEEQLASAKCSSCHTMIPAEPAGKFAGVQCERCHGPGRYYQPSYVMADGVLARAVGLMDPTPAHCEQCHTPEAPSVEGFDFSRLWALIDHGAEARKAWEKARAGSAPTSP